VFLLPAGNQVAIDRESTIRKAEKLLKQGRLEAAIAEYAQAVDDQPRDWNTVNLLGDLYVRTGQIESAVQQYTRVAEHFAREGFFQKAAALYKKIVKIKPNDERVLLELACLSEHQGLLADAKACLSTVAERRRRRGDRRGSAEIILRLAKLDPADANASILAARAASELGDAAGAIARFKAVAGEFLRRGKTAEGLKALLEAAAIDPADAEVRAALARAYLEAGQAERARQYGATDDDAEMAASASKIAGTKREARAALARAERLARSDAQKHLRQARAFLASGHLEKARASLQALPVMTADSEVRLVRGELELRAGHLEVGREMLGRLLADDASSRDALFEIGQRLGDADAAFLCVDLASDAAAAEGDFQAAASGLRAFISRVPGHVPALMKLVEISLDGGLGATMYAAQAQLADAYLSTHCPAEARVIAEDLVAREPWQPLNIERLRRVLVALGEPDPDRIIADHLSGESPFIGTELLMEPGADTVFSPQPAPTVAPPSEPLEGALEDTEIELEVREQAEPVPTARPDTPLEHLFDGWLEQVSVPEAPAEPVAIPPPASVEEPPIEELVGPEMAVEVPLELLADSGDGLGAGAVDLSQVPDEPRVEPMAPVPAAVVVEGAEVDLSVAIEELRAGIDAAGMEAGAGSPAPPAETATDLEHVFKMFRDEAAARGLADTGAQHLKLAVAFRDIGMTGDCIKALEVAAGSPRHRFEAAAMLAQTLREQGRIRDAVEWLERAAETAAPSAEAGRQVLYDLGKTLSDAGESQRALAVFLELQADAPDYRDVAARVQRLSSAS